LANRSVEAILIYKILGLRLPLAIFIFSLLSLITSGTVIIHLTLTSNLVEDGNWLYIATDYCKIKFPKSWYMDKGEVNENGSVYVINILSEDFQTITHVKFFSRKATLNFMRENNLSNFSSVPLFEAQRVYEWILRNSENATLSYIEGETELSTFLEDWVKKNADEAYYLAIRIGNAYKKGEFFYNVSGLFISLAIKQNLIEIIYYGEEKSWTMNWENFRKILSSIEITYVKENESK